MQDVMPGPADRLRCIQFVSGDKSWLLAELNFEIFRVGLELCFGHDRDISFQSILKKHDTIDRTAASNIEASSNWLFVLYLHHPLVKDGQRQVRRFAAKRDVDIRP